jgi:sporulation protein YlmC with PRC-barrel domain
MSKHLFSAVVLAVSVAVLAVVQSPGPAAGPASEALPQKMAQSAATGDPRGSAFLPQQDGSQVLAKSLIGASVFGADGKEIGSVQDLILDAQGRTVGFVVSYGGVLGVGAKEVGVAFQRAVIGIADKGSDKVVRLDIDQNQFDRAPAFKDDEAQQAEQEKRRDKSAPHPER